MKACGRITTFQTKLVKRRYGLDITPAWLDRLRLATVRLATCTGVLRSRDGLILTKSPLHTDLSGREFDALRAICCRQASWRGRARASCRCQTQIADVLIATQN